MNKKVPSIILMEKVTVQKKTWTIAFKDEEQYQRWLKETKVPIPDHRKFTDMKSGVIYVKYPK